jgi:hypothetical protein
MFTERHKIVKLSNAVAAGQTLVTSAILDTLGFDGVQFMVQLGAIVTGAETTVSIDAGDAANGSDHATLEGGLIEIADDQDNKVLLVEIFRPKQRYMTVFIERDTQNVTVDGIYAILYNPRKLPTEADASEMDGSTVLASPEFRP